MMDTSDLRIINFLLRDSRMPLSLMAKELGISQPAVQKRVEKLKAAGIIIGSTLVLNNSKLGWKRAIVALDVTRAARTAIIAQLKKLPFVSVYTATGPYGIVIEMLGPAGVVNGVMAHIEKMKGVADCCAISIVERVM